MNAPSSGALGEAQVSDPVTSAFQDRPDAALLGARQVSTACDLPNPTALGKMIKRMGGATADR